MQSNGMQTLESISSICLSLPDVCSIRLVKKLPGEAYDTHSLWYVLPYTYVHASAI